MIFLATAACQGEADRPLAAPPASRPPNVLLYVIDTLRADHLGAYGSERVATPAIDAFARQGVVFEQAFANATWTRPSMASLLSGLYPNRHATLTPVDVLPDEVETLAERLAAAGYRTAFANANPNLDAAFGFEPGFQAVVNLYRPEAVRQNRDWHAIADSGEATRLAVEWLAAGPEPWFLLVLPVDPHAPYQPPPAFDRYAPEAFGPAPAEAAARLRVPDPDAFIPEQRALYAGEVSANDASFGELLEAIDGMGQADDTLVVLTSDHGEELWYPGDTGDGHGHSLSQATTRVPLVIRYPDSPAIAAGTRVGRPVQLVDVVPTVLELAGLAVPDGLDGRSLLDDAPRPVFSHLAMRPEERLASVRDDRLWLIRNLASGEETWRRASGDRAVVEADASDPHQIALRSQLDAWLALPPVTETRPRARHVDELDADARRALEVLGYVEGDGADGAAPAFEHDANGAPTTEDDGGRP